MSRDWISVGAYANPFLTCEACGAQVERGSMIGGRAANQPCGHAAGFVSRCPAWSPVDGCCCSAEALAAGSHRWPR